MAEFGLDVKITASEGPLTLAVGEHSEEYGKAFWEKVKAEWAFLREEQGGARKRERVAMVEALQPVPARELTGQEAGAARDLFANADPFLITETGQRSFRDGDIQYNFFPDGKVTVHEAGVPTSEEEKNKWLEDALKSLANHEKATGGLSLDELRANYEAASQRLDEIVDRAAATGTSGQIYNTVA
ncbi:hypothetical protein BKI51_05955 [Alphaproteobacteria bacterium AO1-B]|nr:hypothetical protein BKI51_05955 [Alphaproteobacteria bacterium AO1-B]